MKSPANATAGEASEKAAQISALTYDALFLGFIAFSLLYCLVCLIVPIMVFNTPFALIDIYLVPHALGAVAILYGLCPRFSFKSKRFEYITDSPIWQSNFIQLAEATGSRQPQETHILFTDNAWAARIKGKEIVGIGLPFLIMLEPKELQAVICHELAHHLKGDVRIAASAGRLESVLLRVLWATDFRLVSIAAAPYRFFARRFFTVVRAASRAYEFAADRQAAQVVGTIAMEGALAKIEFHENAWRCFCRDWLYVMHEAGIYPQLGSHFRNYFSLIRQEVSADQVRNRTSNKYETHPSVHERIHALRANPSTGAHINTENFDFPDETLSHAYWQKVAGDTEAPSVLVCDPRQSFQSTCETVHKKYAGIFTGIRYQDCKTINFVFGEISHALFDIDGNQDYELERDRVIQVLIACIFMQSRHLDWEISERFTPVFVINGQKYVIDNLVTGLFHFESEDWEHCLAALAIAPEQEITHSGANKPRRDEAPVASNMPETAMLAPALGGASNPTQIVQPRS